MAWAKLKPRIPIAIILCITGLTFIFIGALITIPVLDELEKISTIIPKSEFVSAATGKNYKLIKFIENLECQDCYYYTYAVGEDDNRFYWVPDNVEVELWVRNTESDDKSKFVWQAYLNGEMFVSYNDISSVENERRIILFGIGGAFFLLLIVWLIYSREENPNAT